MFSMTFESRCVRFDKFVHEWNWDFKISFVDFLLSDLITFCLVFLNSFVKKFGLIILFIRRFIFFKDMIRISILERSISYRL